MSAAARYPGYMYSTLSRAPETPKPIIVQLIVVMIPFVHMDTLVHLNMRLMI